MFASLFLLGLIMIAFVFLSTNKLMTLNTKRAENSFFSSCSHILDGYAESLYWYVENYHTSLDSIYDQELFESGDFNKIHDWMMQNIEYVHPEFCTYFFTDKNGLAYFSGGEIIDVSAKEYFNDLKVEKDPFYVSNVTISPYTDKPIFIIGKPVFDSAGKFCGALCASVKLFNLLKITNQINIGNNYSVYLQDREGKFLVHPDGRFIGNTFTPRSEKYKDITSKAISASHSGYIETENENGTPIYLFYSKIKKCDWVLALGFYKSGLTEIRHRQNVLKFYIILISIAALLLLIFLVIPLLNQFYSRQMITIDYDPVTGIWAKLKFEKEAQKLIDSKPNGKFMLVESDIRGFKLINQTYDEEIADKMLCFYSKLLKEMTDQFDGYIGSGYADHFCMFIPISEVRKAMNIFREKLDILYEEIKYFEVPFFPKFGIAFLLPESEKTDRSIRRLIGKALFAKSLVKDDALNQYAIYDNRLLKQVDEERKIEASMEGSLKAGEFFVVYQPKIDLATDKVVGAEALVRWNSHKMGLMQPDKFIPLFENNGFITKLDFYVYDRVFQFICKQLEDKKKVVPISLNMSRNHSKPEKFMSDFIKLFSRYDIPAELVQIEILERSVMDRKTLQKITKMLHKNGFTVAMDDFGSGESSLNMLTEIPVDVLKFDRSFLMSSTKEDGTIDEKSAKFIQILMDLSRHLGMRTVFEGVETRTQRDFLRSIKCDTAQGYFYSKPLSAQEFVHFVEEHA